MESNQKPKLPTIFFKELELRDADKRLKSVVGATIRPWKMDNGLSGISFILQNGKIGGKSGYNSFDATTLKEVKALIDEAYLKYQEYIKQN